MSDIKNYDEIFAYGKNYAGDCYNPFHNSGGSAYLGDGTLYEHINWQNTYATSRAFADGKFDMWFKLIVDIWEGHVNVHTFNYPINIHIGCIPNVSVKKFFI